jgi:hypothetical protein
MPDRNPTSLDIILFFDEEVKESINLPLNKELLLH